MTADEYFNIALPTDDDFRRWTQSLFARAKIATQNAKAKFPELFDEEKELF